MFFEEDRIPAVRKMILADNVEDRVKALDSLLPFQREDFHGISRLWKEDLVMLDFLTHHYMNSFLTKMEL